MHTHYLSVQHVAHLVHRVGLQNLITRIASQIQHDFTHWPRFDKTARLASHSAQGVIELMPVSNGQRYAFKYVNGHPGNPALGLSTVMALGVLADVRTGFPVLLSELTLTTALRTAATSALAARHLARRNARRMAIIGNGAQSEFQAMGFNALLGIDQFHLFDIDPAASLRLAQHLKECGFKVMLGASVSHAVSGVDVITTLTADKTRATILTAEQVGCGVHVNAVGGDCPGKTELHPDVLRKARVFVEYEPQTRLEGDIQQMPADFPVTELWTVLTGAAPGRQSDADITVFDSVGFALEDFSALTVLHQLAREHRIGDSLDIVPNLTDPKNLYGVLHSATAMHTVHTAHTAEAT